MKMTWLGAPFALLFGFATALSAAEMRDVTVEEVNAEEGTVTISGVTYELGEDVSAATLAPGQQVNIAFEEGDDGHMVLTEVEPQN